MKKSNGLSKVAALGFMAALGMAMTAPVNAQALPKEFTTPGVSHVTLLEFSAPWCLSCKKLVPTVQTLEKKLGKGLKVVYLNLEKPETEKYITQYNIESAPTFVVYNRQGKLLEKIERDITPTELQQIINRAVNVK